MSFLLAQTPVSWTLVLLAFIGGYLSGSVPYGLILGKMGGLGDIRKSGSGNIGATNVLRVGGKKLAAVVLLLDGLKAAIPVLVAQQVHMDYAIITAFGAFLGHLFPVWLKFRGGKGVATALGIAFALSWPVGVILCLIWLAGALISRYSSVSALAAFGMAPLVAGMFTRDFQITATLLIISILVWIRHGVNIRRLIDGTETKIKLKK
jgi:glycerol-3-phosphate acyltransferase PlsY